MRWLVPQLAVFYRSHPHPHPPVHDLGAQMRHENADRSLPDLSTYGEAATAPSNWRPCTSRRVPPTMRRGRQPARTHMSTARRTNQQASRLPWPGRPLAFPHLCIEPLSGLGVPREQRLIARAQEAAVPRFAFEGGLRAGR